MDDVNLWQEIFSETPPLGHVLREKFSSRWIRFHALPKSKRYAEDDAEMSMILNRADILANEVLGADQCFLFASYADNEHITDKNCMANKVYNLDQSFNWHQTDGDETIYWTTYWKSTHWNIDTFSPLIKKIADDEECPIIWLSNSRQEIFAPYDGGFDIICETPERVSHLQEKYTDWMSARPDWL